VDPLKPCWLYPNRWSANDASALHGLLEFLARNERLRILHGGEFMGHGDVIRVIGWGYRQRAW